MSDAVDFKVGCRALDDALLSSRLTNKDLVTQMVYQRHTRHQGPDVAGQANGGAHRDPEATCAARAAEETWQALEVMRSAVGDWQTDLGSEHETPVPLGQTMRSESQLPHALSRKPTHGRHHRRSHGASSDGAASPRSTDTASHARSLQIPWHLQEQGKLHRVLYRPGPEGTPFHTMLLEGVLHGPITTGLCICWEAKYFPLWWPQFTVPTFKVSESFVAADISPSHNLTVNRVKVPWPFAIREMGLSTRVSYVDPATETLLVTVSTIPEDPSQCSEATVGYSPEVAPRVPAGVVRLDVGGGYIFKRLGPNSCYFRGAVTVDVKLDVVPIWVINFINRTLAGTGFQVLNQVVCDAVACKMGIGQTFQKLLTAEHTLYTDIEACLAAPPLQEAAAAGAAAPQADWDDRRGTDVPANGAANWALTQVTDGEEKATAGLLSPALDALAIPSFAGLTSLSARDPELSEALGFLDEVIVQVRNDTMSMYSEVPPTTGAGRKEQLLAAQDQARMEQFEKASIPGGVAPTPAEERKKAKKRWWKRLGFRKAV